MGAEDYIELDSTRVWTCPLVFLDPQHKPEPLDESMELLNGGQIFWGRNYLVSFSQDFDVREFPYDEQSLLIQVDTFGYSDKTINFTHHGTHGAFLDPEHTIFDSALWTLKRIDSEVVSLRWLLDNTLVVPYRVHLPCARKAGARSIHCKGMHSLAQFCSISFPSS